MNELPSRNDFHISGGQRCSCFVSGFWRKNRPLPVCSAGQTMVVTADMIPMIDSVVSTDGSFLR